MKKFFTISCLFLVCATAFTQQHTLKFNDNGTFKIVQFTDLHYIADDERAQAALENIKQTLEAEKPDLVLLTGDLIYGRPAEKSLRELLTPIVAAKTPFAVTFGNHDDEYGLSRQELLAIIQTLPHNLTTTVDGLSGVSNFILPIKSSDGQSDAAVLYCFDSHAYCAIDRVKGYDYIKFDQIAWYRENSTAYTSRNNNRPLPSLAFFHIPFPEYAIAAADETAMLIGTRKEKVCAPFLNSGLFTAMQEMNDVKGVFVGHDHDNDYAVYWKGILLAYGRYGGGNTVYNNLKPSGARIIELTEGEDGFRTWIRLKGGELIHNIHSPQYFMKK